MPFHDKTLQFGDLSFYPPLHKRARKREVYVTTDAGRIKKGIRIIAAKGKPLDIHIPDQLQDDEDGRKTLPLSPLDKESLQKRIKEALAQRRQ